MQPSRSVSDAVALCRADVRLTPAGQRLRRLGALPRQMAHSFLVSLLATSAFSMTGVDGSVSNLIREKAR